MKPTRPFRWYRLSHGEQIEEFLQTLCFALPGIAIDILRIGFGDLRSWFNNSNGMQRSQVWKVAKCGCLVGTFAVQSRDEVEGCVQLVETHPNEHEDDVDKSLGAAMTLYMAIAAATKRNIHEFDSVRNDPLYDMIVEVGCNVGDECTDGYFHDDKCTGEYQPYDCNNLDSMSHRDRTQEVGQYLLDYMRLVLTGMGYKNLPKSPEIPCKLV
jgi:hypothetical protein